MTRRALLTTGIAVLILAAAGLACGFGGQPAIITPAVPQDTAPPDSVPPLPTPFSTAVQGESANVVQAATYALAVYLGRDPGVLDLVSVYQSDFPDTALGCPRPGEGAAETITPGYTVILSDGERDYELHTSLDGLRVRCLSADLRPDDTPGSTGVVATINALENREYGTLATLLPPSIIVSTYPGVEQELAAGNFVAQLRDIWLGPAELQVDLNTNVLALMPGLELPPNHIPVYSTGWGAGRDTDGVLFFDMGGPVPLLSQVLFIPAGQKEAAYAPAAAGPEHTKSSPPYYTYQGSNYTVAYPQNWYTFTVDAVANFQPPDERIAITLGPWSVLDERREGQNFRDWIEANLDKTTPGLESINTIEPIWAASGQVGYLLTWNSRRQDGVLESSDPIALFEISGDEYPALAISLLNPDHQSEFQEMVRTLAIQQALGVPADMNIYRHDELGYRLQFPAEWKLLPSPIGAAFQPPEKDVAISIGPWPMPHGPAAGQPFEEWVVNAPAQGLHGYGAVREIQAVEGAGGDTGYLVTWQVGQESSEPMAVFPFRRQWQGTAYHALAISLHVPTYTPAFERMIATLVIESQDTAEMVHIPAGPFVRGSSSEHIAAWTAACGGSCRGNEFSDETPQQLITLGGYFIDRTETTVVQFRAFVEATGYRTTGEQKGDPPEYTWRAFDHPDRQNHPVRWMSWDDADAYCRWAGKRLPTEAEWEKAARAGDDRVWPWGNDWDDGRVPHGDTAPVDSYPNGASPYGVLGLAGNVWEWVADWYDPFYYSSAPDTDPAGPPQSSDKVLRGGGFTNANWAMRAMHRHYGGAQGYATDHGFRCAADG